MVLRLQEYDIQILYRPGKSNLDTDALSRASAFRAPPDDQEPVQFLIFIIYTVLNTTDIDLLHEQRNDTKLLPIIKCLESSIQNLTDRIKRLNTTLSG